MLLISRWSWQPHVLAIAATVLLHAALIGGLLAQQFDNPPPAPKVRSIQMRFVSIPAVVERPPAVKTEPPQLPIVQTAQKAPQPEKKAAQAKPEAKPQTKAVPESKAVPVLADKPVLADTSQAISKSTSAHKPVADTSASSTLAESGANKKSTATESKLDTPETLKQAEATAKVQAVATAEPAFDVKNFQPVSKQVPDYPARAMDQGLQGDCTVSYSVNAQGRVENPQAEADCHPLFVRPALNAAKNFQYQPRMVNGQAVVVQKVRNTFQFRINGH